MDKNPTRPNEAYFTHVDFIVDKAEALGMFVGFLPTWGNYWKTASSRFDRGALARSGSSWVAGTRIDRSSGSWVAIRMSLRPKARDR